MGCFVLHELDNILYTTYYEANYAGLNEAF